MLLADLTTSGTTLSSFNYTYNPAGNRTQVVEANGDVLTLSYNPTYQLTNEKRSGANSYNISYTYDPVGNRTVLTSSGALTTNTYNAGNELVTSQARGSAPRRSLGISGWPSFVAGIHAWRRVAEMPIAVWAGERGYPGETGAAMPT